MLTPFSDLKTNEMSMQTISNFFVSPKNIDKIYTPNATFIRGHRGTGKTTLMRYISNKPKYDGKGAIEYIGVYLRFDRTTYSSKLLSQEEYSDVFSHYLVTILLVRTMKQLKKFFSETDFEAFEAIASVIAHTYYSNQTLATIDEVLVFLENQRMCVAKYIRNSNSTDKPNISDYSGCLERLMVALHNEQKFSNLSVLFLLDEFENLNKTQQSVINAYIKAMEHGYSFKVFHRPFQRETSLVKFDGEKHEEYLKERDDYVVLDFYDDIIGGDSAFQAFVKNMCSKRLEHYYRAKSIDHEEKHLEISHYLENISDEDEFSIYAKKPNYINEIRKELKKLVSTYPTKDVEQLNEFIDELNDLFQLRLYLMLLTKLNEHPLIIKEQFVSKSRKYKNWIHNYKKAVLYLVCHENHSAKHISGINDIIYISGNITRYVLNILHYIFISDQESTDIYKQFKAFEQTEAITKVSDIAFKDIDNIPNLGPNLKALINYVGSIFLLYHKDKALKVWEPNHFVITASPVTREESVQLREVILASLTWGVISKADNTKLKNKDEYVDEASTYFLHPIFSSHFGISYRKKQKCYFSEEELCGFILGDLSQKKEIYQRRYSDILNEAVRNWSQITLFKGDLY